MRWSMIRTNVLFIITNLTRFSKRDCLVLFICYTSVYQITKEEICGCTTAFTDDIRCLGLHYHLSLGSNLWSVVETSKIKNNIPNMVTLLEQIRITQDKVEKAFDRPWSFHLEKHFPSSRVRYYFVTLFCKRCN